MFEWDEGNADHIAEHRVTTMEVEEALLDRRRVFDQARKPSDEQRWAVLGATEAGRVLFVVFTDAVVWSAS